VAAGAPSLARTRIRVSPRPSLARLAYGCIYEEADVFISQAFAQTAPAATGDTQSSLLSLLPLVLMFVVLYFIMIRPQMKRQKEHKAMVEALAKGDEIVTAGGVLGRVSKLGETFLSIEVANGVELQVQRTSVVQVLPKGTLK
jgi:preprotein translocase subunit YajC